MLGLFKKKSEKEKLQEKYNKLMQEYHSLSKTDRTQAEAKYQEAEELIKKLDTMKE